MNITSYTGKAREYIDKINENRLSNSKETIRYARLLLQLGCANSDDWLSGYARYHLCESYYFRNDISKSLLALPDAVHDLSVAQDCGMLARCHNLYGLLYSAQGNISDAVYSYLAGISSSHKQRNPYMEGILTANIGFLYHSLQDYRNAAHYFIKSIPFLKDCTQEVTYSENMLQLISSLGLCYCNLNELDTACEVEKNMDSLIEAAHASSYLSTAYLFLAKYHHAQGCYDKRDHYIEKTICITDRSDENYLNTIDNSHELGRFLLDLHHYDAFQRFYQILDTRTQLKSTLHVRFQNIRLWIRYLKETGQADELKTALEKYHEISCKLTLQEQMSAYSNLKIRMTYENVWRKQLRLERKKERFRRISEIDTATGLPNRFRLNDYLESAFETASRESSPLALGMLDIDHFKQYNDLYGHLAGDRCILALAEEIKVITSPDVFCARYGGDEFILVYTHKTPEEIMSLAENLRNRIIGRSIPHAASETAPYLTISQGIFYQVPNSSNRAWDYLHVADEALYQLKKKSRNAVNFQEFS